MHKLAAQLRDCQDEQKKLRDENEHLREQIAEMGQLDTTLLKRAYDEGYKAGLHDTRQDKFPEDNPS
jgi:hypothetical protein